MKTATDAMNVTVLEAINYFNEWMTAHDATCEILQASAVTSERHVDINFYGPDGMEDDVTVYRQPDGALAFREIPL